MVRRHKNGSFSQAFIAASRGLMWGVVLEANVRRQFIIGLLAVAAGWWLTITPGEWLLLVATIGGVLVVELINTAVEVLADALHPDYSEYIQRSKDILAGAVLLAALVAMIVGLSIFLPPLLRLVG